MGTPSPRVSIPFVIYVATAITCWFAPSSIEVHERYRIINAAPAGPLAIASSALALVHLTFGIAGRLAVTGAVFWAATTVTFTMAFATELLPSALWLVLPALQTIGIAAASCTFGMLTWHVGRGHLAPAIHWIPRGTVALGFALLALLCGELAWSGIVVLVGVASPPRGGLEAAAQYLAELTISLWLCSAVFVLGVVMQAVVLIVHWKTSTV